ncbi:MAG TPA: hypothetical protein QF361_01515 [Gammaproteobacteria bacterium]|nr:hypothetical protein [Gammaproteobacteria bacterium]
MDALRAFIADWLDPIGIVLGLAALVPIIWTWWDVVFGRRRRERRWFSELARRPGERPAILIVDLLPHKDVRAAVENFRRRDRVLAAIPNERIATIVRDDLLTPTDMPHLHGELRAAAATLLKTGTDCVHYFHAGPAVAAALVGAEFANGARVVLYQHDSGSYGNFGPLRLR